MAATTAEPVNLLSTDRPIFGRSDSVSSNGSGLARRRRIRSRTRTLPDGSVWSDSAGAPKNHIEHPAMGMESQVTGAPLVAEPVQSVPPPRPPRSPRRSGLTLEDGALDAPDAVPRERKISATSARSVPSGRGASLEEWLALKNVRVFFFMPCKVCIFLIHAFAGHCWQTGSSYAAVRLSTAFAHDRHCSQ